jgi:cobalt-zinc-cadmium efflux system membrane fusion protein
MNTRNIVVGGTLAVLAAAAGGYALFDKGAAPTPAAEQAGEAAAPAELTDAQLARLGVKTAAARLTSEVPLGAVPGVITLPPESRVAVTASLPGAIRQVFVIEGQEVRRGQPLATMVSRDAMELGGSRGRASARVGLARANLDRAEALFKEGVIAGARVQEARAELAQAQSEAGEAGRILAASGASGSGLVTLRAPISGRVSKVAVQTGGPVDGLTAPFVIDAANAYQLDLQLPERLGASVRPGMTVSLPGNATGRILSVGSSIDPATRSIIAKASLGSAQGLIAGKSVMVSIGAGTGGAGTGGEVVSVPSTAVTRIEDKDVVFVREGKRFIQREVRLGGSGNGETAILSGLKPGEVVATSAIPELKMLLGGGGE